MKVLITGGKGFIGRYLTAKMNELGWEVCSIGHNNSKTSDVNGGKYSNWQDFEGNPLVTNQRFDALVHLAAKLMINNHTAQEYFGVNACLTFNVLEYCRVNKIPKIVYAMTHSDMNNVNHPIHERMSSNFKTNSFENNSIPFVASKIAGANMVEAYTNSGAIKGVILRLANIRGVGSSDTKYNSPFHQFIKKARAGESIEIWGNPPKTKRDLIYIKDVVDAIIKSISIKGAVGTFNIGSGQSLTVKEEVLAIKKVFCQPDNLSKIIYRSDIPELRKQSSLFNINRARILLNWKPKFTYVQALEDMKKIMEKTD
ncbi:MAG: NAD(P)-dependent oxidoreductase [Eubacteriales bacterium]